MHFHLNGIVPRSRPTLTPAGLFCLCLSLWGCVAIYSATSHLSRSHWFVGRQLVWVALGAAALLFTSGMPQQAIRRALPILAAGSYSALWLVLIFGIRINGMRGWFAWRGIFVQPSEIGKPIFVLALAAVLTREGNPIDDWRKAYLPALAVAALWGLPIALQPDFGALLIYGFTFAAMYWVLGGRPSYIVATVLAAVPLGLVALQQHPYLQRRLAGFLNPGAHAETEGWHVLQCQRAFASGGGLGRSFENGRWAQAYLPLGHSDSVFASAAEAVGFVGVLPVVLLILVWVIYGYRRAEACDSRFASAVIIGIVTMLAGQALIHLSVNLGLFPPTGITLPLISYGGSSLIATLTSVGVVEAMARRQQAADVA